MFYDDANRGIIQNRERARQIIDFSGLRYGNITPTDVDGLIEYRNRAIILIEMKHNNEEVPRGQWLALTRLVDDSTTVGKDAVLFICEHNVDDCEDDVIAATSIVRTIYYKHDRFDGKGKTLKHWVDKFIAKVDDEQLTNFRCNYG